MGILSGFIMHNRNTLYVLGRAIGMAVNAIPVERQDRARIDEGLAYVDEQIRAMAEMIEALDDKLPTLEQIAEHYEPTIRRLAAEAAAELVSKAIEEALEKERAKNSTVAIEALERGHEAQTEPGK